MKYEQIKLGVLIFLSNLFLYLALEYKTEEFQKIIIPLYLNFKPKLGRTRIKIIDSFGDLITDEVYLNFVSNQDYQNFFLVEVPPNEISKITIIKTDILSATLFKE